jgi:regulation of enolase protein 1 (concanavalin A-like superfamily)
VGLGAPGDELRIRLTRTAGKFSMSVENRTSGATSSLQIRHPEFLDGRADLIVGLFACEPRGQDHEPVRFSDFSVTVWKPAIPR